LSDQSQRVAFMMNFLRRPAAGGWQSRQMVVTAEQLGMRSVGECRLRAEQLGFTPLPALPYKQEYWRLDALLLWSRGNGLDRLPVLGLQAPHRR
jgi:hypothetical protein